MIDPLFEQTQLHPTRRMASHFVIFKMDRNCQEKDIQCTMAAKWLNGNYVVDKEVGVGHRTVTEHLYLPIFSSFIHIKTKSVSKPLQRSDWEVPILIHSNSCANLTDEEDINNAIFVYD